MRTWYIAAHFVSLLGLTVIGCAPVQLGENWGTAYQTARQNQTLNPEAGETLDPVVGLDGKAAMIAIEEYRKTFEQRDAGFNRSLVTTGVKTN